MSARGDFNKLMGLVARLRRLGTDEARRELAARLGAVAVKLVADGFAAERNPYGRPWAKLKRRVGRILEDTGRLKNSFYPVVTPKGFAIRSDVGYAVHHQYGAPRAHLVKRAMFPTRGTGGFGNLWREPLEAEAQAFVREAMGR